MHHTSYTIHHTPHHRPWPTVDGFGISMPMSIGVLVTNCVWPYRTTKRTHKEQNHSCGMVAVSSRQCRGELLEAWGFQERNTDQHHTRIHDLPCQWFVNFVLRRVYNQSNNGWSVIYWIKPDIFLPTTMATILLYSCSLISSSTTKATMGEVWFTGSNLLSSFQRYLEPWPGSLEGRYQVWFSKSHFTHCCFGCRLSWGQN